MPGVYILPKEGQHQEMEEEKNYKGEKWKKNKKEKD